MGKTEEGQLRGEGRLTDKLLRQKLQRGKGPLVNLGAVWSSKGRDPQDFRQGLR